MENLKQPTHINRTHTLIFLKKQFAFRFNQRINIEIVKFLLANLFTIASFGGVRWTQHTALMKINIVDSSAILKLIFDRLRLIISSHCPQP